MTRRELLLAAPFAQLTPQASVLAIDIPTCRQIASEWPNPDRPFPAGSLMKPFVAIAYGSEHAFRYPRVNCRRCWKPDGHGLLSLTDAIAFSCNTYFLELAHNCTLDIVARVAVKYGLPQPPNNPGTWIGLGPDWAVSPLNLLNAYSELSRRRSDPGPKAVLPGMRQSALAGTARALGLAAFAKTGTGPCTHPRKGQGDGYAVVLFPAANPATALIAGLHNRPGSEAAREAGAWIRSRHRVD